MGRFFRRSSSFGQFESGAVRLAPSQRYRVAMRVKGDAPQIVWATNDRVYARAIAAHLNALAGEERAWVDSWEAEIGHGRWVRQCAPPAGAVIGSPTAACARPVARAPRSGELVQAVLLAERTRLGGWRARLVDYALEGPITNRGATPALATARQQVTLRVAAANQDGTHLQLEWV
jgi:hypothetical protein